VEKRIDEFPRSLAAPPEVLEIEVVNRETTVPVANCAARLRQEGGYVSLLTSSRMNRKP